MKDFDKEHDTEAYRHSHRFLPRSKRSRVIALACSALLLPVSVAFLIAFNITSPFTHAFTVRTTVMLVIWLIAAYCLFILLPKFWKTAFAFMILSAFILMCLLMRNGVKDARALAMRMGDVVAEEMDAYRGREGQLPARYMALDEASRQAIRAKIAAMDIANLSVDLNPSGDDVLDVRVGKFRLKFDEQARPPTLVIRQGEFEIRRNWSDGTWAKKMVFVVR